MAKDGADIVGMRIRTWMLDVMTERSWSADQWAAKSKTSATNITRFLKDGTHLPSSRTIAKLAGAANRWPMMEPGQTADKQVPILNNETVAILHKRCMFKRMTEAINQKELPHIPIAANDINNCFAVRIETETLSGSGIKKGDLVVIDPVAKIGDGDVACFYIDGEIQAFQIGQGVMTSNGISPVRMLKLKDHKDDLMGRIMQVTRNL